MTENWKLQVSIKTPAGDLINIRGNTADELSVLMEGIGDYAVQIAATQRLLAGAYTAAPLGMTSTTPVTELPPSSQPTQVQAQPDTGTSGPTCLHGARKYKSGVSAKTGNPYAMWVCPLPQGVDQCKPVN